eukprot:281556-Chlamydomonas_euryale.AAC.4
MSCAYKRKYPQPCRTPGFRPQGFRGRRVLGGVAACRGSQYCLVKRQLGCERTSAQLAHTIAPAGWRAYKSPAYSHISASWVASVQKPCLLAQLRQLGGERTTGPIHNAPCRAPGSTSPIFPKTLLMSCSTNLPIKMVLSIFSARGAT